jgi:hypothetical protein
VRDEGRRRRQQLRLGRPDHAVGAATGRVDHGHGVGHGVGHARHRSGADEQLRGQGPARARPRRSVDDSQRQREHLELGREPTGPDAADAGHADLQRRHARGDRDQHPARRHGHLHGLHASRRWKRQHGCPDDRRGDGAHPDPDPDDHHERHCHAEAVRHADEEGIGIGQGQARDGIRRLRLRAQPAQQQVRLPGHDQCVGIPGEGRRRRRPVREAERPAGHLAGADRRSDGRHARPRRRRQGDHAEGRHGGHGGTQGQGAGPDPDGLRRRGRGRARRQGLRVHVQLRCPQHRRGV